MRVKFNPQHEINPQRLLSTLSRNNKPEDISQDNKGKMVIKREAFIKRLLLDLDTIKKEQEIDLKV